MEKTITDGIVPIPLPAEFQPDFCCKWDDWTEKFDGSVGSLRTALKEGTVLLPQNGVIVFSKRVQQYYLFTPGRVRRKQSADVQVAKLRAKKAAAMQTGDTDLVQKYKNQITDILISQLHQIKEAAIEADDLEKAIAIKRQILALVQPSSTSATPRDHVSHFFAARGGVRTSTGSVEESQHVMNQLDIIFSDLNSPADATKAWTYEASRLFAKIFAMHCSLQVLATDGKKITDSISESDNREGALHKVKVRKSVVRDCIKFATAHGEKIFKKRLRQYLRDHQAQHTQTESKQMDAARAHVPEPSAPSPLPSPLGPSPPPPFRTRQKPKVSPIRTMHSYSKTVKAPATPAPPTPTPTSARGHQHKGRRWGDGMAEGLGGSAVPRGHGGSTAATQKAGSGHSNASGRHLRTGHSRGPTHPAR